MLNQSLRLSKFDDKIQINFGLGNEFLADTTVVLERSNNLDTETFEEVYRYQTVDDAEIMNNTISSEMTPYYFHIEDDDLSQESAFYRVRTE